MVLRYIMETNSSFLEYKLKLVFPVTALQISAKYGKIITGDLK